MHGNINVGNCTYFVRIIYLHYLVDTVNYHNVCIHVDVGIHYIIIQ